LGLQARGTSEKWLEKRYIIEKKLVYLIEYETLLTIGEEG
jgi:hypothetical protein